ncbi:hypothetical protein AB0I53_20330 [Saccharopolyspora sp. NPDC050389]|uniref:hypothetical protein n=1 Tax=Saccharopolyspora sp. NPDC050389 TaxID=3155516 RepID=UPI0033D975A9
MLAVLLATSCSTGMEKSHSPRRTVAVEKYDIEGTKFFGGLTPAKLRAVDPCALLRATNLSQYGVPGSYGNGQFGSCSLPMTDHSGAAMDLALFMNNSDSDVGENRIGGLPAAVKKASSGPCLVRVAFQGSDGTAYTPQALGLQVDSKLPDPCSPAVQIMTDVVEQLRTDPPIANRSPAELAGIDPCFLLDPLAGRDPQASATTKPKPRGLYECVWEAPSGVRVDVSFASGPAGDGELPPVDIGGVVAKVTPKPQEDSCRIEWEHRQPPGSWVGIEKIVVVLTNHGPVDRCADAVGIAREVKSKMPPA